MTADARRSRYDFVVLGAGRVGALLATAVGIRILTELASPTLYGEFKLITAGAMLGHAILGAPFARYAMRVLHESETSTQMAEELAIARYASTRIYLVAGLLLAICSAALFTGEATASFGPVLVAASTYFISESTASFEANIATSTGRIRLTSFYETLRAVTLPLAAGLSLYLAPHSSSWMVISQTLVLFALTVGLRLVNRAPSKRSSIVHWYRQGTRFITPLMLVGVLAWLFSLSDRFLLGALGSTADVGRYAAAYGLAATAISVAGGLLPAVAYSRFIPLGRSEATRGRFRTRLLIFQTLIVTLSVTAVVFLAPYAIRLLLDEAYRRGAYGIMFWVAVGQGFQVLGYVFDLDAYAAMRTQRIAIAFGAAFAINLVMNLTLIPTYHSLGAAIATTGGGLTYFLTMWMQSSTRFRFYVHK